MELQLPVCSLRPIHPPIRPSGTGASHEYDHPLLPQDALAIQRNKLARTEPEDHVVSWSYLDDAAPDSEAGEALDDAGRGRATGNGEFVRSLRVGDVVTIWAKARFPGWVNMVESLRVDVYWAV